MKQDLVGRKYNKLLVISEEEQGTKKGGEQFRRFKCLCDCGNTVTVAYSNLVFGHTKTCGCSRRQLRREHKNLVGQKFGRLTVIAEAEPRRCSGNLNQYAKKANQTGSIYARDITDLRVRLDQIYDQTERILAALNALQY